MLSRAAEVRPALYGSVFTSLSASAVTFATEYAASPLKIRGMRRRKVGRLVVTAFDAALRFSPSCDGVDPASSMLVITHLRSSGSSLVASTSMAREPRETLPVPVRSGFVRAGLSIV